MSKQEQKLLELTEKIVDAIANTKEFQSEEEKESCFDVLKSLEFFMDQGNYDRAITEAEYLLKKLNK